jgi:hypothetical protein
MKERLLRILRTNYIPLAFFVCAVLIELTAVAVTGGKFFVRSPWMMLSVLAFLSAVQLAADCVATLMAISDGRAVVEKQRKLSGFAPFYYPIGGGGNFQLRRYELDGNDFVFGVNLEARLLFKIPAVYRSFSGRIIAEEVENTTVEIINDGEVVRSIQVDGDADIAVEVENPSGIFGLKVRAPRGKGELTFADGVFNR